ncbi:diguanylate cyclase [Roseateles sp. BYS180W]|uniref:diguanylate cyclase n=1 Tax=Roseateles rivi TaxID=3299028 RepID=A0ABW7FUF5_9BURK
MKPSTSLHPPSTLQRRAAAALLGLAVVLLAQLCMPGAARADDATPAQEAELQLNALERRGLMDAATLKADIQRLDQALPLADAGRLRLRLRLVLARLLHDLHDVPAQTALLQELDQWPEPELRMQAQLTAHLVRAMELSEQGDLVASRNYLRTALVRAPEAMSPMLRWQVLNALAEAEIALGELTEGVRHLLEGVQTLRSESFPWLQAHVQIEMAQAYLAGQQLDRAEQALLQAQQLSEALNDPWLQLSLHNANSRLYRAMGKPELARAAVDKALHYAQSTSRKELARALCAKADDHYQMGKLAAALELAERARLMAQSLASPSIATLSIHTAGLAKIGLSRVAEGRQEVIKQLLLDEERGLNNETGTRWRDLGLALERAGDLSGAVQALHRSRDRLDYVQKAQTKNALLEAQARYDDEQRAQQIEQLNRKNLLHEEQIRNRNLQQRLWLELGAGVLVIGTLLVLAYRRSRHLQHTLHHTNELLRINGERDSLTGLANRRHVHQQLPTPDGQLQRGGCLLLMDIDHFKCINDHLGHGAGDTVLSELARRLQTQVRAKDLLARWGGEEFLLWLPETQAADAHALAQRLMHCVSDTAVELGSKSLHVSLSLGYLYAPAQPSTLSWEQLLALADLALYRAKHRGRARACGITRLPSTVPEAALLSNEWFEQHMAQQQLELTEHVGNVLTRIEGCHD